MLYRRLILLTICFICSSTYMFSQLSAGIHGGFITGNSKYQVETLVNFWYPDIPTKMWGIATESQAVFSFGGFI